MYMINHTNSSYFNNYDMNAQNEMDILNNDKYMLTNLVIERKYPMAYLLIYREFLLDKVYLYIKIVFN